MEKRLQRKFRSLVVTSAARKRVRAESYRAIARNSSFRFREEKRERREISKNFSGPSGKAKESFEAGSPIVAADEVMFAAVQYFGEDIDPVPQDGFVFERN